MAERSFKGGQEAPPRRRREFRGEGILAVTKALLQSGVSYVSGYRGAPISRLVDVLADANDMLQGSASASRRAPTRRPPPPLAASVNYPLRGAAPSSRRWAPMSPPTRSPTWPRAASPAARWSSSARITAKAPRSCRAQPCFRDEVADLLLDPRPNLPSIVHAVENFELSEASTRRSCWSCGFALAVYGSFTARDNVRSRRSGRARRPMRDTNRVVLPPASYLHEKEDEKRWPAAVRFVQNTSSAGSSTATRATSGS